MQPYVFSYFVLFLKSIQRKGMGKEKVHAEKLGGEQMMLQLICIFVIKRQIIQKYH